MFRLSGRVSNIEDWEIEDIGMNKFYNKEKKHCIFGWILLVKWPNLFVDRLVQNVGKGQYGVQNHQEESNLVFLKMARCTVKSRTGSEKLRVANSVDDLHHVRTSFFRVLKPQYRHNNLRLDVSVGCFLAIFHCIFFFRLLTLQIDEAAPRLGLPFTFSSPIWDMWCLPVIICMFCFCFSILQIWKTLAFSLLSPMLFFWNIRGIYIISERTTTWETKQA